MSSIFSISFSFTERYPWLVPSAIALFIFVLVYHYYKRTVRDGYTATDAGTLVTRAYQLYLNRLPDPAGYTFWVNQTLSWLNSNDETYAKQQLFTNFVNSVEYTNLHMNDGDSNIAPGFPGETNTFNLANFSRDTVVVTHSVEGYPNDYATGHAFNPATYVNGEIQLLTNSTGGYVDSNIAVDRVSYSIDGYETLGFYAFLINGQSPPPFLKCADLPNSMGSTNTYAASAALSIVSPSPTTPDINQCRGLFQRTNNFPMPNTAVAGFAGPPYFIYLMPDHKFYIWQKRTATTSDGWPYIVSYFQELNQYFAQYWNGQQAVFTEVFAIVLKLLGAAAEITEEGISASSGAAVSELEGDFIAPTFNGIKLFNKALETTVGVYEGFNSATQQNEIYYAQGDNSSEATGSPSLCTLANQNYLVNGGCTSEYSYA